MDIEVAGASLHGKRATAALDTGRNVASW